MLKFIPSLVAITHSLDIAAKNFLFGDELDFFKQCECNYKGCEDGCCDETCKFNLFIF
jgi:hypothetical protein